MITEIFFMDGYGIFVWSAFSFTFLNFLTLYIIIKRQLNKEQEKFDRKYVLIKKTANSTMAEEKIRNLLATNKIARKI
tara:strand:- start:2589 stop:2822 length:234 start_codon:yes stop_codon:yes gene_type:complete